MKNRSRFERLLLQSAVVLGAILVNACSCGPDATRPTDPPNIFAPLGTLQGAVVDAYDQRPLPGAKVIINFEGTSKSTTTGDDGTFAIPSIPASGNPGSDEGATGTYTVILDLTGVNVDGRTYKPYRTQQVSVQFTSIESNPATGNQTPNPAVGASTPVGYLVSNVNFMVAQARAVITGRVLNAVDLTPMQADLMLISAGGAGSSHPNGSVVAVASSAPPQGTFEFTAIEEGVNYRLVLADQNLQLQTSGNNYNGGNFLAAQTGVATVVPPVVVLQRSASDNWPPYVTVADPVEDSRLAKTDTRKAVELTFNERMDPLRPQSTVQSFKRVGLLNQPDDSTSFQLDVPFIAAWDSTATKLQLTPLANYTPGYRYRVTFVNGFLKDLAGNQRSGYIPGTSPQDLDAVAFSGGMNDLDFGLESGATELAVVGLSVEPDTADNQTSGTTVRAFALEALDPADQSFTGRYSAAMYTANTSNNAYIYWTPTAAAVRYNVYTRGALGTPILITRSSNPWGITTAKTIPVPALNSAYNISLNDLRQLLLADPAGNPGTGLPNTTWDFGLSVDLGVSAVNGDGREGAVSWLNIKDNTSPIFASNAWGLSSAFVRANDSAFVDDNSTCASVLLPGQTSSTRVYCPQVPLPHYGNLVANEFGKRVMIFELSEYVDVTTVTPTQIALSSGYLPNNRFSTDPNTAGGVTESDATVLDVKPYDVVNGRTKRFAVLFGDWFGLDTGDSLTIKSGANAVKDGTGNIAKDTPFITLPLVDRVAPMIKSVSIDPATDTVKVVLTKWVAFAPKPPGATTTGNMDVSGLPFVSPVNSRLQVLGMNHALNGAGDPEITVSVNDVGLLRGFDNPNCAASYSRGTRVQLSTSYVQNLDVQDLAGNRAAVSDDGRGAFVNMAADPLAPGYSPGAYLTTAAGAGIGTRSSMTDLVGPRLSGLASESQWSTSQNQAVVPALGTTTFDLPFVHLTEYSSNVTAESAATPANWAVKVVDLGTDGWTGNTGADAASGSVTATVQSAVLYTSSTACLGHHYAYVTLSLSNSSASPVTVGAGQVTLSTSVKDLAGNAVSGHNVYTYNPARQVSGAADPGFDRN